ncbi:hypothetical protein [Nocardia cyriacigeorgica]|uniref:hypothetical protein n=1 Tax=Nocardia cyriacigeorgica TaxID=135487 RepID=UPI0024554E98|nr:hypothetical protein [Nocardia cyriacigeorgica]
MHCGVIDSGADLDPDRVATILWASLNGVLSLAWRTDSLRVGEEGLNALFATFAAMVGDGLRTRHR